MKLKFDINNSFGIKKLKYEFDFDDKPFIIHAPNGTFKTSFCKTIKEYKGARNFCDRVTHSSGSCSITMDGTPLDSEEINVFDSKNQFESISGYQILLNSIDKTTLELCVQNYETKRINFERILQRAAGERNIDDLERHMLKSLNADSFDEIVSKYFGKAKRLKKPKVSFKNYNDYFSETISRNIALEPVKSVLGKFPKVISKTFKKYPFLKKNVFELNNLINVKNSLKENRFFECNNKIFLDGYGEIKKITDLENLIAKISASMSKVITEQEAYIELQTVLREKRGMDKVQKNIDSSPIFVNYYLNYEKFERDYFLNLLNENIVEFENLYLELKSTKKIIKEKLSTSLKEKTIWTNVISTFNNRFDVPFKIEPKIENVDILGFKNMSFVYKFDGNVLDREEMLNNVLSDGELKVFNMLNILFDIEKLIHENNHKILVFDDVADMFDYANKHCIIEYLYEIAVNPLFDVIVLTHNFDFYRHFGNRICQWDNALFASKTDAGEICISKGNYLSNVFNNYLKENAKTSSNETYSLSLIPFCRSIVELTNSEYKDDPDYLYFTNLLHYRPKTGSKMKCSGLYSVIKKVADLECNSLKGEKSSVYSIIFKKCNLIKAKTDVNQKLEEKIILSLGLRILSEKYMIKKLQSVGCLSSDYDKDEMGVLFDYFKTVFPNNKNKNLFDKIRIFTPMELHLNGFAYEPLIDYSINRYRLLFKELWDSIPKSYR